MSGLLEPVLRSWPPVGTPSLLLLVTSLVYFRGWIALRGRDAGRWRFGKLIAFQSGCAVIFLALGSPIEAFASFALSVHMVQHVLLLMAAPPLLLLGDPLFPMLRGLPASLRSAVAAPLLRLRWLRRFAKGLTHPMVAFSLAAAVSLGWHIPAAYELALRSNTWHYVQHASFLLAALVFWYPVVRPYPSRPEWSLWLLLPYLLFADVVNTALSAVLTFSDRVLYPTYLATPNPWGASPLADQAAAGVVMWIPGSMAYLVPLVVIAVSLIHGPAPIRRRANIVSRSSNPLVLPPPSSSRPRSRRSIATRGSDLLRLPWIGGFLKWRYSRAAVQSLLLLLAVVVIIDGLTGPQVGAMNLAGILPWTHWRGFAVLGLLLVGNVFCFACPFTLPRALAGRHTRLALPWPRMLRHKWLSVGLVLLFLWSYEAFSLWDSPWWTAWIALGYFVAAFTVDSIFRGASFCKYVCPIGQFHFVQSLVSPGAIQVREPAVCTSCKTVDCVKGNETAPGCPLELIVPKKSSNMDCTFCLDCVHACPNDNVGWIRSNPLPVVASAPLALTAARTTLLSRLDVAVLMVLLSFAAFANAAAMVEPVMEAESIIARGVEIHSPLVMVSFYCLASLVVVPALLVATTAMASRGLGRTNDRVTDIVIRFAPALVPMGFAMWLAHYLFHLVTGWRSAIPAAQRFAADVGVSAFGLPSWSFACCESAPSWLLPLEITILNVGLLASLYVACWKGGSRRLHAERRTGASVPWAILIVALYLLGLWILFQPMQMRGTLSA